MNSLYRQPGRSVPLPTTVSSCEILEGDAVRVIRRRPMWMTNDYVGQIGRVMIIAGPLYYVKFTFFDRSFFYLDEIELVTMPQARVRLT